MKLPESDRVKFEPFSDHRSDFWKEYLKDPILSRYLPFGRPYTDNEIDEFLMARKEHWVNHGFGTYLLKLPDTDTVIGYCGLEYANRTEFIDVRYGLKKEWWGKGLASEPVQSLISFGFKELGLNRIYGAAVPENKPSIKLLKTIGMLECSDVDFYRGDLKYFYIENKN